MQCDPFFRLKIRHGPTDGFKGKSEKVAYLLAAHEQHELVPGVATVLPASGNVKEKCGHELFGGERAKGGRVRSHACDLAGE